MSTSIHLTLAALVALAAPSLAQDLIPSAAAQEGPVLLRGATIHTVSGDVIAGGDLPCAHGVIQPRGPHGPAHGQIVSLLGTCRLSVRWPVVALQKSTNVEIAVPCI